MGYQRSTWGPLPQRKHSLIMLQVLFLASLAAAVPAPEADPLLYTGHPLTYSVPYVTYHAPVCKTEFEEVKGQSCVTKPVTECKEVEVPSHKIITEDVCQNVTTAECAHSTVTTLPAPAGVYSVYGKREAEADPQLLVGAVPAFTPYHNCVNKVTEVCYPVQKVEPTTVTEQSRLLKGEVECTEVVVATIPRVTCSHAEHTKPADEAVETE